MKTKHVIQILAFITAILFFVPTFCVSCSGVDVTFSATKLMVGVEFYGEKVSDPVPAVVFCLIIPIVIFAIWFIKNNGKEKALAGLTLALSGLEIVIWFVIRYGVSQWAEDQVVVFKTLAAFKIIMILNGTMIVIAAAILLGVSAELKLFSKKKNPDESQHMILTEQETRYCPCCGEKLREGSKFCSKCGSKIE